MHCCMQFSFKREIVVEREDKRKTRLARLTNKFIWGRNIYKTCLHFLSLVMYLARCRVYYYCSTTCNYAYLAYIAYLYFFSKPNAIVYGFWQRCYCYKLVWWRWYTDQFICCFLSYLEFMFGLACIIIRLLTKRE